MVSFEWSLDRTDGVTLVTLRVESPDRSCRVRVQNRLDGPVWPPREHGCPAPGWDETGFEGVVGAGETLALGYASPAEPVEPPAEVVAVDPVEGDSPDGRPAGSGCAGGRDGSEWVADDTPVGVVRSLGDPVVPREAVPVPGATTTEPRTTTPGGPTPGTTEAGRGSDGNSRSEVRPDAVRRDSLSERLAAIERRLAALER